MTPLPEKARDLTPFACVLGGRKRPVYFRGVASGAAIRLNKFELARQADTRESTGAQRPGLHFGPIQV